MQVHHFSFGCPTPLCLKHSCLFKNSPALANTPSAMIGQLTHACDGTAHCVSVWLCLVFRFQLITSLLLQLKA